MTSKHTHVHTVNEILSILIRYFALHSPINSLLLPTSTRDAFRRYLLNAKIAIRRYMLDRGKVCTLFLSNKVATLQVAIIKRGAAAGVRA